MFAILKFLSQLNPIPRIIIFLSIKLIERSRTKYEPMAIISGDYVSSRAMLQGRFEILELEALANQIFPSISNEICLDVGANIGNHSVFFSSYFNQVYAVEPNRLALDILEVNAKWHEKIKIFPYAASDREDFAPAKISHQNIGATKICEDKLSEGNYTEFRLKRLDSIIPETEYEKISFIKFDVEGHEFEAMLGAEKIISKSKPVVAFEALRVDFQSNMPKILNFLEKQGYNKFMTYKFGKFRSLGKIKAANYKMILAFHAPDELDSKN